MKVSRQHRRFDSYFIVNGHKTNAFYLSYFIQPAL